MVVLSTDLISAFLPPEPIGVLGIIRVINSILSQAVYGVTISTTQRLAQGASHGL
jgi:hypothetical protein